MPERSKYVLCTCLACPENGQLFPSHALAAHKAKVAILYAQGKAQNSSLRFEDQDWTDSLPEDLILESVERLATYPGTNRSATVDELAGALENLSIQTSVEDVTPQDRAARRYNSRQEKSHLTTKALGALRSINASLQLMDKKVQALEHSIFPSSSESSQALLSAEETVLHLRLKANAVKREVPSVQDARKSIYLHLDLLEARILEMKALLPPADASRREFDCGTTSFPYENIRTALCSCSFRQLFLVAR